MTSHPSQSYTLRTSSTRPTPCVPSTIVRTLCVATVISRLRARARFLVLLCRRKRRSALPRRLRLRVKTLLLFMIFSLVPLSLYLFLPCLLVSRLGSSRPTPRRSAHLPSPGRIWYLLTGSVQRTIERGKGETISNSALFAFGSKAGRGVGRGGSRRVTHKGKLDSRGRSEGLSLQAMTCNHCRKSVSTIGEGGETTISKTAPSGGETT